ncbi:DUF6801 domain-containing protein [Streptomyces angustmyceticus]|uniref:DUF6801 domain-containing protein n=1 Tax=Streptomyces angustmyceticus TaxID=285578 RepID=UPI00344FD590
MTARRGAGKPKVRIALGAVTALGAAVAVVGVSGAGTAAAQPVSRTLKYTCKVPVIKHLPFTVKIDADIPRSVAVGEASRKFPIGARTTVDADLTAKLRFLGVKTVTGRVVAKIGVSAPHGDRRIRVPLGITRTRIPASGSFEVAATGAAPALTFSRPGKARITVGDIALHVVGKKASGAVLGEADAGCRLNAGQQDVVGSFEITGAAKSTGSTRSGASTTSGAPGGSGTSAPSGTSGTSAKGPAASGATPERTSVATHEAATGTTATTGQATRNLVLPIIGTLVVAALAFCFGAWRKNRRRAADSG